MKKIKKGIFILFLVIVVFLKLFQKIGSFDEIWNFNMARNFLYGNLPYKDFNMIIFPAFPFLLSVLLKIFGNEFLVYRVFQMVLGIMALIISWKIIDKFEKENNIALYFISFTYFLILVINNIIEYNFFSLVLIEAVVLLEFSEKKYRNRFFIGLLLGFIILTKQTIGISCVVCSLISICFSNNKNKIKNIITELVGVILPIIILIIYVLGNSIQTEFIDYTFYSLIDFLNNGKTLVNNIGIFEILVFCCTIVIGVIIFILFMKSKKDDDEKKLLIYAISMISVSIPIWDIYHLVISAGLFVLLFIYKIKNLDVSDIDKFIEKHQSKILAVIYGIIIIICGCSVFSIIKKNDSESLNHFKYMNIRKSYYQNIENVNKYILENPNTYVLDAYSTIYSISLDKYNNYFDMPLVRKLR